MQDHGLKPEILFCDKHKGVNKNSIPIDRVVDIHDKESYVRVYFETLKCVQCHNLPAQLYKCPRCSSFHCKDCMIYQKDEKMAEFCPNRAFCKMCLSNFNGFPYSLSKFDNFKIKEETKDTTKELKNMMQSLKPDRNIDFIIKEDIKIKCIYFDCGDKCKLNQGRFEEVLEHQLKCTACEDCRYLCSVVGCECSEYYSSEGLKEHANRYKEEMEELERLKVEQEKADREAAEALQKQLEDEEEKKRQEEEEKKREELEALVLPNADVPGINLVDI